MDRGHMPACWPWLVGASDADVATGCAAMWPAMQAAGYLAVSAGSAPGDAAVNRAAWREAMPWLAHDLPALVSRRDDAAEVEDLARDLAGICGGVDGAAEVVDVLSALIDRCRGDPDELRRRLVEMIYED